MTDRAMGTDSQQGPSSGERSAPSGSRSVWSVVISILKYVVPLAIIAWLLWMIPRDQFEQLRDRPKDWPRLITAFIIVLSAVAITFVRWYFLVRALGLKFRLRDAFRLGFLAYLLNFVSISSVGGDLFKAVFIAREQPGKRTEAVATVAVDRVVGMYGLLLVTSLIIWLTGVPESKPIVAGICHFTFAATGIAIVGLVIVLLPGFTQGSLVEFVTRIPRLGPIFERLIGSLRMYRRQPVTMAGLFAISMAVHTLLAIAIYLLATGLFQQAPTLAEHFLIVPLSNVAGTFPTPAGLGSFELVMHELYRVVPADSSHNVVGVLVALAYRLTTIGVTAIGVVYYWTCRREVRELLKEAKQDGS